MDSIEKTDAVKEKGKKDRENIWTDRQLRSRDIHLIRILAWSSDLNYILMLSIGMCSCARIIKTNIVANYIEQHCEKNDGGAKRWAGRRNDMLKLIKHIWARLGLINSLGAMVAQDTAASVGTFFFFFKHPACEQIYMH